MKGIRADGTPIKVMAVDDSPISRKMIKKALAISPGLSFEWFIIFL